MIPVVFPRAMAALDAATMAQYALPGRVLMERASLAVTDAVCARFAPCRVAVLCGPGNNGGDGLAVARLLHQRGFEVTALSVGDPERYGGDARGNWDALKAIGLELRPFAPVACDLVVDAVFGVGLDRPVAGAFAEAVAFMEEAPCPVVAVDMPSGIHGGNGAVLGTAVHAAVTVTFGCMKPGQWLYPGRDYVGELVLADIGIPAQLTQGLPMGWVTAEDVCAALPVRRADSHKGTYGRVTVAAGSREYPGAGALCATAALNSGAGLVSWAFPEGTLAFADRGVMPKRVCGCDGGFCPVDAAEVLGLACDVLAVGPGLGRRESTVAFVRQVLAAARVPVVIDADGLFAAAQDKTMLKGVQGVMTPHTGEMARLCGVSAAEVQADPLGHAQRLAEETGLTVLLKGPTTVVAASDGRVALVTNGNAGMATGGSGDVLTGLIAALAGMGMAPFEAAWAGAWIHGNAGDIMADVIGMDGLTAEKLIEGIARSMKALRDQQR